MIQRFSMYEPVGNLKYSIVLRKGGKLENGSVIRLIGEPVPVDPVKRYIQYRRQEEYEV